MRVYGLKLSVKSQAWLLCAICFGLAVLHPPLSGLSMPDTVPFDGAAFSWRYNFFFVLQSGGIFWHVVSFVRWQGQVFVPISYRVLVPLFAPYCFVPVTLPLCALFLWRYLVDFAPRPTLVRGLLAVSLAFMASLALVFVLDQLGGRLFIYTSHISFTGNLEVRSLITTVWITSIVQSALLVLPCLATGGALAWRQRTLEGRLGLPRQAIQGKEQD